MSPMIKFTFGKGESDRTFVAAGKQWREASYQDYGITGSWSSPLEDGKTPVELKINYGWRWEDIELKGVFDPEENSLRGTQKTEDSTGEFVLKRGPDLVRFYPAPSVTNARRRWEFATTSVRDHTRRQAWSPRRILKRIKDGKRFMELTVKQNTRWTLSDDDKEEALTLFSSLYEGDVQFYSSLLNAKASKIVIFSYVPVPNLSNMCPLKTLFGLAQSLVTTAATAP
jgi:hypothetical protein